MYFKRPSQPASRGRDADALRESGRPARSWPSASARAACGAATLVPDMRVYELLRVSGDANAGLRSFAVHA